MKNQSPINPYTGEVSARAILLNHPACFPANAGETITAATPETKTAAQREEKLRQWLSRYGRHDTNCPLRLEANLPGDDRCTCGFSHALAVGPA